jgi:hypothetical protein
VRQFRREAVSPGGPNRPGSLAKTCGLPKAGDANSALLARMSRRDSHL